MLQPHVVSLKEAPRKRSMCENKMRYDVLLNGAVVQELYFNMKGYVGCLPLPHGHRLDIGERSISAYKTEIRKINKEARHES